MGKTRADAIRDSLEYFGGDAIAADCFIDKYALRDNAGGWLETSPEQMHRRLAREFARIESNYPNPMDEDEIFGLLDRFRYVVPQGSPMSGIGNDRQVQSLSNCFVIESPSDSYGGIHRVDEQLTQIMKRRGGVGFDISTIRPRGLVTANAAQTTDGIGVFMERFSNSCREVAQGGRRGALMLTISVHHPEIETFINIKRDLDKVTGANVSVRVTDEFMEAVRDDKKYQQRFPIDPDVKHSIERWIDAKDVWDQIVDAAHDSAEPGILFWDTVKRNTPADVYESLGYGSCSTNPCSEISLSPFDSCRLMAINLTSFVSSPFKPDAAFNFDKFSEVAQKSQRLMDDLVDLELESLDKIIAKVESDPEGLDEKHVELSLWKKIRAAAVGGRRTGLGITGLGDTIAMLGMPYASEDAIAITERVYKALEIAAYRSTCILAKERGAFPVFSHELESNSTFIQRVVSTDTELTLLYQKYGRRNIALTTTAPTGTVSILTQTTSGFEPAIFLKYSRRRKVNPVDFPDRKLFVDKSGDHWLEYDVIHHGLRKWMDVTGKSDPAESPYHGSTAEEIDYIAKVDMQAAAQRWICHALSMTDNLPEDVSKQTVSDLYFHAWSTGCKGLTVYRKNSRSGVIVENRFQQHDAPERPDELECSIHHATVKGEAWTIFIGLMEGKPYEIFGGLSSMIEVPKRYKNAKLIKRPRKTTASLYDIVAGEGDDQFRIRDIVKVFDNPTEGALTRMISLALRTGTPVHSVCEQLQKDDKSSDMFSFSRVIARVLKGYIADGTRAHTSKVCPECGSDQLIYAEGCARCVSCSYTKCM